jgi:SAM-dependent methyltransferase
LGDDNYRPNPVAAGASHQRNQPRAPEAASDRRPVTSFVNRGKTTMRNLGCLLVLTVCLLVKAVPAAGQTPAVAGAPYVPTPTAIVDRMLTLAEVGPNDYVIDLGSGDGRLVIAAVANYNARGGMGVEIDRDLVKLATDHAEKAGVASQVSFVAGDLFLADIARATVVTLYLLPTMMKDVEAKLRQELKPGTRVVSHDYPLPSWEPVNVVRFDTPEKIPISGTTRTVLLLYRVPARR